MIAEDYRLLTPQLHRQLIDQGFTCFYLTDFIAAENGNKIITVKPSKGAVSAPSTYSFTGISDEMILGYINGEVANTEVHIETISQN